MYSSAWENEFRQYAEAREIIRQLEKWKRFQRVLMLADLYRTASTTGRSGTDRLEISTASASLANFRHAAQVADWQ